MKVDFKGGKAIEAALKELDISQARKRGIARRALDKAAEPIRDAWAQNVDEVSGDLKRSIKIGSRAQTRSSRRYARKAGKDIVERYVGIDARESQDGQLQAYAYIEEFGNERQAANPAGRNAFEGRKMEAFDMVGDLMWEGINKIAKKA